MNNSMVRECHILIVMNILLMLYIHMNNSMVRMSYIYYDEYILTPLSYIIMMNIEYICE